MFGFESEEEDLVFQDIILPDKEVRYLDEDMTKEDPLTNLEKMLLMFPSSGFSYN